MDANCGREGSPGGEETGTDFSPKVPRCGHLGRKRYSLLRKQRLFPRLVFRLILFRVSPLLFTFPAFFFVSAPRTFFPYFSEPCVVRPVQHNSHHLDLRPKHHLDLRRHTGRQGGSWGTEL